jgi:hypothetical protein
MLAGLVGLRTIGPRAVGLGAATASAALIAIWFDGALLH